MSRFRFAIFCLIVLATFLTQCKGETGTRPPPEPPETRGPGTPQRIVSLAPSVTETIYALGRGDRLVAVTRFCDYPAEAAELPKVGGLTDVDVELVLSLEPDLVVGVDNQTAPAIARSLERAEIEALFLPVENLAQVRSSFDTLGQKLDAEERAKELAANLELPPTTPDTGAPAVLVLLGSSPWIAAGPGTFADEILRGVGGTNVLGSGKPYPTLDAERLGSLQPDLVLDTSFGEAQELPLGDDVRRVRVDPALIRPGPRLANAIELFRTSVQEVAGGE